ncbi:MAG: methionyl-tRNA formyltransferase, partial [Nitrospinae bacterium]|nr:methionyl-tRNA formyltransferase [Nitrospinota bacterium]
MTPRYTVVFMGTPDFAVPTLAALIEGPEFDVRAVVTQPDRPRGRGMKLTPSPVKNAASAAGVPVLQPEKAREAANVELMNSFAPDFLVVVAYGQILPRAILEIPAIAPVNLHASLLPRWRGAAPIHRAILEGDSITGVCAMIMEEGLDTGPMLACRKTEITEQDTVGRLHDRLAAIGAVLMTETLPPFARGEIAPRAQDNALATYAKKLDKKEFGIDWNAPAELACRRIRGLSPFPGASTALNGARLKPLFARVATAMGRHGAPGEILAIGEEGITAACGEGAALVTELKPEGKP